MSVAISNKAAVTLDKNAYDAEFDAATVIDDEDEDTLGPAKMCWFTCLITGL